MTKSATLVRCQWPSNDLSIAYHDKEWGVPVHDDRTLFEFLTLEGAQAGLSWDTVLKSANATVNFSPASIPKSSSLRPQKVRALLKDPGIIRNRLKIESTISNAKAFLEVQKEFGTFDKYIWSFVNGKPIQNAWKTLAGLPAFTSVSDAMSKDLKNAASASSAPPSVTPSCKPSAWSTITPPLASVTVS